MEIYSAEAVNGTDLCGFNEDPKDHLQTSERALVTDWYLELHHYPVENVTGGKSVFVIKVWFKTERLFSSRQVSLYQRPSGHLHSFTVILCYWTAVHVSRTVTRPEWLGSFSRLKERTGNTELFILWGTKTKSNLWSQVQVSNERSLLGPCHLVLIYYYRSEVRIFWFFVFSKNIIFTAVGLEHICIAVIVLLYELSASGVPSLGLQTHLKY